MSDLFRGSSDGMTDGHPTTRNLTAAPDRAEPTGPISATYPDTADQSGDAVAYGPDIATEAQLRLIGTIEDRRILLLGCGSGAAAVALARQGARVVAVDPSARRLEAARANIERAEVKVELHQSDLAELPFVRADSIDSAVSIYALANVDDLDRVFRQVHRVLHAECMFVFSLPHPAYAMLDPDSGDPPSVVRSYFEQRSRPWSTESEQGEERVRTIGEIHTSLSRANFRTDTIIEAEPIDAKPSAHYASAMRWAPATLIVRGRKEGV
ncbi:MAG: methyltransferase domain-containing protein [Actinomycetes bacterium]